MDLLRSLTIQRFNYCNDVRIIIVYDINDIAFPGHKHEMCNAVMYRIKVNE